MENCGFSVGSKENGGWSDACLSSGSADVSPHTNWEILSRFKCVCNDALLRLLMLIHTLAVRMFASWLSRWLKDRAAGEKLSLTLDKVMIFTLVLWCWHAGRTVMWFPTRSVSIWWEMTQAGTGAGLDADFFLSFQKVFFVRIQWRVITALGSCSLGALVGLNRLVLCLACLVYVPSTCCGLWGSVTTLQQLVNTKPKPFATHCFSPSSPGSNVLPSCPPSRLFLPLQGSECSRSSSD